mgnify:CR=1 FL=1
MARPIRIQYENALYHVTSRGLNRQALFRDDADCERRLVWLKEAVMRFGWKLHAFCLMGNHDHLFVQTPHANLADGMKLLNAAYTQYFNVRHRRTGAVLEGRYKAQVVEAEGHYAELSRYIHLNPVRARSMAGVSDPADYAWSSFRGYVRKRDRLDWVTYARVLAGFGPGNTAARCRRYAAFVRAGIDDPPARPWHRPRGGAVIGSEAFFDSVRERLGLSEPQDAVPMSRGFIDRPELADVVAACAAALGVDPGGWAPGRRTGGPERSLAAYVCRNTFHYRGSEVARALGYYDAGSVTRSVARVTESAKLMKAARRLEKAARRAHSS